MDITAVKQALIALKQKFSDSSSKERYDKSKIKTALRGIKKQTRPLFDSNEERALWLCDNYYMISREAKLAIKSPLPLSRRLAIFIKAFLNGIDCKADVKTTEFFYDIFSDGLDDEEIEAVAEAMKGQLIILLYENITDPEKVKNCIVSLRFVSTLDITPYILGFSQTERILRTDSIYVMSDKPTQGVYKKQIKKLAKKEKLPPCKICEDLVKRAVQEGCHIGEYLIKPPSQNLGFIYFCITAAILGIGVGIFAAFFFYSLPVPLACVFLFLSLLPLYLCSRECTNTLCPLFAKGGFIPKLKLDKIPSEYTTLTVITQLLASKDDAADAAEHIEKIYLASRRGGENIYFGLLCDLPEASAAKKPGDDEIISLLCDRIESLNLKYGSRFCLFVRRRKYNRREGVYMGYERKRGAILDLVSFIRAKSDMEDFIGDRDALSKVKYVITLDSDTDMGIDTALKLIGAMAHPLNRPKTEKGRVVSGYGIMQPLITTCLESAYSSPFSLLLSGAAGNEPYMGACYDVYQAVFGRGLFCGKGIFDVDCFDALLCDAFPDNTVLSHDIPEGMRLSCAFLGDVSLCDGIPKNALSYFKREHRWIRGDVQALALAGKRVKNKKGELIKNPIDGISRFILYDNVLRHISPICSALLIVLSSPFGVASAALAATLPFIIPFILQIIFTLFSKKGYQPLFRQFFSNSITGLWRKLILLFYNISALAYRAYINCDAIIRALWRMNVSKKKLLEWSTASEADKHSGTGFTALLYKMKIAPFVGIFIFIFSVHGLHRLYGILFLIYPIIAYFSGKPYLKKRKITEEQKNTVLQYVKDMWGFFDEYVTSEDNFLPPDNISLSPVESVAHRTSPTNIGLYLLSVLAARDFGIIDSSELYKRLNLTLCTIEKMEKFKGHLYNWYDTVNLCVIGGGYISTVDSGNFITNLVALSEGMKEYVSEEPKLLDLIVRCEHIADSADLRALYNSKRELFYLGSDGEKPDSICYDLYMSEARTTSYYAIAKGYVTKSHWGALGRTLLKKSFHLGAASWSGTAFEYFMPPLLLPVFENSFEAESLRFAYNEQKAFSADGIWGISESQFFAFDSRMNYMYKAFGIPALRLARGKCEKVIAPYSAFLMMKIDLSSCLENLEAIKKAGIYGKYGFFEAADFDKSRTAGMAIVKSYMSHHLGMSIIAASNAVSDDIFVRRFMSNPYMKSADELLKEKIPVDAIVYNNMEPVPRIKEHVFHEEDAREITCFDITCPTPALLYGKDSFLLCLDSGISSFAIKQKSGAEITVNRPRHDILDLSAGIIAFAKPFEGKAISNLAAENTKSFIYSDSFCEYELFDGKTKVHIKYSLSSAASALNIKVNLKNGGKEDSIGIYFEPSLATCSEYRAHPAYSSLFIKAEFDGGCLLLSRGKTHIAIGAGFPFEFETRKEALFEKRFSLKALSELFDSTEPLSGNLGACISPAIMLKCAARNTDFTIAYGKSRAEAIAAFAVARRELERGSSNSLMAISEIDTKSDIIMRENLLRATLPQKNLNTSTKQYKKDNLYRYGISGDLPVVALRLFPRGEEPDDSIFAAMEEIVATFRLHSVAGYKYDLVILIDEQQKNYLRPYTSRLYEIISKCKCDYLLGSASGIFPICADGDFEETLNMFEGTASSFIKDVRELFAEVPDKKTNLRIKTDLSAIPSPDNPLFILEGGRRIKEGVFYPQGFLIDKEIFYPKISWSHIIASPTFGTLINDTSLGYTWFSNSRERRLTLWENSSSSTALSEKIYFRLKSDGRLYDLCAAADRIFYGCGYGEYYGCIGGNIFYNISVTIHPKLLFKAVRIKFSSSLPDTGTVYYNARPVMGDNISQIASISITSPKENMLTFKNMINDVFFGGFGYLYMPFEKSIKKLTSSGEFESSHGSLGGGAMACVGACADISQGGEKLFVLGFCGSEEHLKHVEKYILKTPFENIKEEMTKFILDVMPKSRCGLPFPLDELRSFWLPYQSIVGRFFARSGAYQSSGAYGFRDQLQDALIFTDSNCEFLRRQIFRAAAHQFEEGDVMHWWHNVRGDVGVRGVRTLCSDDYLWLPYAVERYISATKDTSILDKKIKYITAPPLSPKERERYGEVRSSHTKESLFLHCKRAIDLFVSRGLGAHGLPFMGSCDWNDGMSEVGLGGGESVWLAFFARIVLHRFSDLCESIGEDSTKYRELSVTLRDNIENNCYFDGYYARAFFADGTPLGVKSASGGDGECEIDLLPQAFASICHRVIGDGNTERITSALNCAYTSLYDRKHGILKLFTPAFDTVSRQVGYIKNYPVGLRENGGQYTHGAVWGAFGFLYAPDETNRKRGKEIAESLSPAFAKRRGVYMAEPYVIAGDVYSNPEHMGRGGWSWYTGAAHWYYKLLGEL